MTTTETRQRLLLPGKVRSLEGAEFDVGGIEDALTFLDIEKPVEVKWSAGLRRRGAHRFRDEGHVITISTYLTSEQASQTLWHELVHAAQLERFDAAHEFDAAYTNAYYLQGYGRNEFETEAREVARAYSDEFRLTK